MVSCRKDVIKYTGNAGTAIVNLICFDINSKYKAKAVYCLRDFLIGEDAGGEWQQLGIMPQNISSLLVGDNPCIEWSDKTCGQYDLMYIVGDGCCKDTAYVSPIKCCLVGQSNCN
jgi:hypothetical protein